MHRGPPARPAPATGHTAMHAYACNQPCTHLDLSSHFLVSVPNECMLMRRALNHDARPLELFDADKCLAEVFIFLQHEHPEVGCVKLRGKDVGRGLGKC